MTKDCTTTDGTNLRYLEVGGGKSFTIEGAGYTIYPTSKSYYNDVGTAIGFENASNITLTLRNLTIDGGGDSASPEGGDPDPAIVVKNGNLILDGVTIQNTRGGAIRLTGSGTVTLKNVKLIGNQVSGAKSAIEGAAITVNSGQLNLQNLFTLKTNTGGVGAMHIKSAATLDIDTLYCLDVSGNQNSSSTTVDIHPALTGTLKTKWDGKPTVTDDSCDENTTPTPTATPVTPTPVTPTATPVSRPSCKDSSVMGWNQDLPSGRTFTMTKDCTTTDGTNLRYLEVGGGKSFTINGAGYTIYPTSKSYYNDVGTAFGFESGSNITLTLRNLTIDGGGDSASPEGGDPDPAIVVKNGNLILDGVTIQNTRGGAIRLTGSGTVTLKNVKLIGNQVSGAKSAIEGAAITVNSGQLNLQNLFTLKTNVGGVGAMHIKSAATLDIDTLYCLDVSGNQNASSTTVDIHPALTGALKTKWDGKPTVTDDSCDENTTPTPTATPVTPTPVTPTPVTPTPTPITPTPTPITPTPTPITPTPVTPTPVTPTPVTPTPVTRPDCGGDSTVMGWNVDAPTGRTFTMTKDCTTTDGTNLRYLEVRGGKSFTINGAGYTIYPTSKSYYNDVGTAFGFESGSNITLTLRNLTIDGGGGAASPEGGDPDPAIVVKNGNLILDGVTIQNTRGGAIRLTGSGTVTLKNVKLIGNQVSGAKSAIEGAAITVNSGQLNLQNLFTLKTNTGGVGAMHIKSAATLDIDTLYCLDVSGNQNSSSTTVDIHPALTGTLKTKWDGKPTVTDDNCDENTTPTPTATPVTPTPTPITPTPTPITPTPTPVTPTPTPITPTPTPITPTPTPITPTPTPITPTPTPITPTPTPITPTPTPITPTPVTPTPVTPTPVTRPDCRDDSTVMDWNPDAASGTTFTMTKDCTTTDGTNLRYLEVGNGKTFTINGAGFTIYAAGKSFYNDVGTAFGFEGGSNITLTLRNLTIEGGGDAASPEGGDPDPAIVVKNGNLILDGVTIRQTRGGAIRVTGSGKVTLKNSKLNNNRVSGTNSANEGAAITMGGTSELILQNLLTAKNNRGGQGAIYVKTGASINIDALGCKDVSGNQNAGGTNAAITFNTEPAGFRAAWNGKPRKSVDNCDENTTPTPTATPVTPTPVTPTPVTPTPTPVTPAATSPPGSGSSTRPSCRDASVMAWNSAAASGTTFTMKRDCDITKTTSDVHTLYVGSGKTFTIDGAGFTIYAADKALFNDRGTVFNFDGGSNITLHLRNLTIEGGGDAASPIGSDPDPAIVVRGGTVTLNGVTIQNTRGGAIRIAGSGKAILKNSTFNGNQVSGTGAANEGTVVTVYNGGRLFLQGLFTAKNNTGGQSALYIQTGGVLDIYDLGCKDVSGNFDSGGTAATLWQQGSIPATLRTLWQGKPSTSDTTPCTASTASTTTRPGSDPAPPAVPTATPTPVPPPPAPVATPAAPSSDQLALAMAMADVNYGRRVKGTLGLERSAYYHKDSSGVLMLQIYRVDGDSSGHWVMNVSQAAIDAVSGAGCVASSPDGRFAVRVWADRNITISDGPDQEGKIFHNTLQGGVNGPVIATQTTYSSTPPGVGCPGYSG